LLPAAILLPSAEQATLVQFWPGSVKASLKSAPPSIQTQILELSSDATNLLPSPDEATDTHLPDGAVARRHVLPESLEV
jgi:hypothetical protein